MTTTRPRLLRFLVVALGLVLLGGPAVLASAADQVAFSIRDSRVTHSSGLVRDPGAQLYWTVNAFGTQGTVYGLNAEGDVQGVLGFRATPVDVEAVAMHDRRLYVADIGDRRRTRAMVTVYFFDNPRPNNQTVPYRAYDFSYPDGAHDAATLLVDAKGRLYLVTKELKGGIYVAPKQPSRQGVNPLRRVADAPAFVTDGVFLPDDNRIALRTYVSLLVLDGTSYQTVASAATPPQKQGESVAVSLDGRSLLVGSAGKRSSVVQVAVPSSLGNPPTAGSKPPPIAKASPNGSPSASDPGAEDDAADEDAGPPTRRAGTMLALALAALVALLAGVVVAARRD